MYGGMYDHDEKQAARILEVSTKTLARYRKSGLIGHFRLPGGRVRYSTEQLHAFVAATRVASEQVPKCPRLSAQG
jgi:predicted site-specific integrase-resolvase